jgi:serine/arginine repetitive matrix protein 2
MCSSSLLTMERHPSVFSTLAWGAHFRFILSSISMSRKSQSSSARSSRFGVRGLGFPKSPTTAQPEADDWYIPYNGPYEVPKDYLRNEHQGDRKDAIYKVDDTVFGHKRELHYRSGIEGRKRQERGGWSSEPEERKVRNKLRAPANSARASQRRSPHTSSNIIRYTPASTFSSGGGIGESPMPIQRQLLLNPGVAPSNRLSLANFLSFGAKKTTVQWPSPLREYDDPAEDLFAPRFSQTTRRKRTTSQDEVRPLLKAVSIEHLSTRHSVLTDDEDYYSTLASHPKRDHNSRPQYFGDLAPRSASKQRNAANPILEDESEQSPHPTVTVTSPNPRPHPYAYVFPSAALSIDAPRSAPPVPHAVLPPPKQKASSSSSEDNHASTSRITAIPEHLKPQSYSRGPLLKGSISTPNLRGSVKDQVQRPVPRGKERWLSAETWCDALLFPRPRFKIKHGGGSGGGSDDEKRSSGTTSGKGSGRIVSPPETPILRMDFDASADLYSWTMKKDAIPTPAVPPRPNRPRGLTLPTMTRPPTPPITRDLGVDVQQARIPRRPAKDDLELPSPVLSLNRYLVSLFTCKLY